MATFIRQSTKEDIAAITSIYTWNVLNASGTFEIIPPGLEEMASRREGLVGKGLPWLVAESEGRVLGYAYANYFRPRPAYRFCVEDSVYLDPDARGQGLGKRLLAELITHCEALGARQMVAVIGDSANEASIGLHRSLGFESAGLLKSAGHKFGRWVDVVMMQRALNTGDADAPPETPLQAVL